LANLIDHIAEKLGPGPHGDYNIFLRGIETAAESNGAKLNGRRLKLLQTELATRDERAAPVIKKTLKTGNAEPDTLHGLYAVETDGRPVIVEYEPDPELRDTEQIPLLEPGGIEAFFRREVLPHVPDAWIDGDSIKVGYEISFTRYFYKPEPLRSLEE